MSSSFTKMAPPGGVFHDSEERKTASFASCFESKKKEKENAGRYPHIHYSKKKKSHQCMPTCTESHPQYDQQPQPNTNQRKREGQDPVEDIPRTKVDGKTYGPLILIQGSR